MTRSPLTFRLATDADVDTIAELGYHSFPMAAVPLESRRLRFTEDPRVRPENHLVGEADGRVVAALHSIPFTTWIGGAPQPMQGVASVVVAQEARRRGYGSELVLEAMRQARAAGTALSTLYPFRHSFYAALGYAPVVERRVWEIVPDDLPHYAERSRVRRATDADRHAIDACYMRVARRSTLMVERAEADWERRHFDGGRRFAAVYDDGARVRGYFLYQYREYTDGRHTRLVIPEIVYEDQEALRGLLGYVAALRDQFLLAECVTSADERLDLRLRNPRSGGEIKGPISEQFGPRVPYGAMTRVLDVERAFRARGYPDVSGSLRLAVVDEHLAENRGPWTITWRRREVDVARAEARGAVAEVDVGTLAQLYLGAVTASTAREIGLLEADDDAVRLLDAVFAGPKPYLMDHF